MRDEQLEISRVATKFGLPVKVVRRICKARGTMTVEKAVELYVTFNWAIDQCMVQKRVTREEAEAIVLRAAGRVLKRSESLQTEGFLRDEAFQVIFAELGVPVDKLNEFMLANPEVGLEELLEEVEK